MKKKLHQTNPYLKGLALIFFSFCIITSQAQRWRIIGNQQQLASATANYTHITTVYEDTVSVPYVVFTESGSVKVRKLVSGVWLLVGDSTGIVATGNLSYTRIISDRDGNLFVSYMDGGNGSRLAVKAFNSSADAWQPLNNNAANLYVSTGSVNNAVSQYSTTPRSQMAFDTANRLYIVFGDGTNLNPTVKRFNGTIWESVGTNPAFTDRAIGVGIAVDSTNNRPYIVYLKQANATASTGSLVVARLNGAAWDSIPIPNPVTGGSASTGATLSVRYSSIAFNKSWNPVVTYFNTGNSNRNTAIIYNKATSVWNYSATISTRDAPNSSLVRDNAGNVYSSFADIYANGSGRSVARVFKLPADSAIWRELKTPTVTDGIDEPVGNLSIAAAQDSSRPIIVYTKANSSGIVTPIVRVWGGGQDTIIIPPPPVPDSIVTTPKQMEKLTRGLVAVRSSATQVYIGWRMFGTDSSYIAFNVYRNGTLINATPVTGSTNYVDNLAVLTVEPTYTIRPVLNGIEQTETAPVSVWSRIYKSIGLQIPAGGMTPDSVTYTYTANDCSVGDVDGDGEYEIFLKWDPTNSKDNSQPGHTGNVYIDCYKMNGTRLWRVDLGRNIRAGAHYTQFMVYDLDGDGKAEMACKTADATVDGVGTVIGNPTADYRNSGGYILSGPEFLTVFNGMTGAAMATTNYLPARGTVTSWGDNYGNRVNRFVNAVAYLDGQRPSLIMGRGYYTRLVRAAWDWRNGQLTLRWIFDSNNTGSGAYAGQGNHQLSVGDVDGDGKDEIVNGASTINDNGRGLYANGLGHGDALHMTDMDPDRPGLEVMQPHEDPGSYGVYGLEFRDAKTGQPLQGAAGGGADVGRGIAADIDPRYKGLEYWGSVGRLYNCKGDSIGPNRPYANFAIWWDGDLSRELLNGNVLDKWNYTTNSTNRLLTVYNYGNADDNNGTKANPGLTADLLGDWREEIVMRNSTNDSLLIFTTTIPTDKRIYTLMHDPQYRVAVAWQNTAYNQPPHPGFYLGTDMNAAPKPNIYTVPGTPLPVKLLAFNARENNGSVNLTWKTAEEKNNDHFTIERSKNGKTFISIYTEKGAGNSAVIKNYTTVDAHPFTGINYYRLKQTDMDGSSIYSSIQTVTINAKKYVLTISPNPVTNFVKLNLGTVSQSATLRVTSSDGKVLISQAGSVTQMNNTLNSKLSTLSPGLYLVEVIDGAKTYLGKMMKK